jgi:hypothetical protein
MCYTIFKVKHKQIQKERNYIRSVIVQQIKKNNNVKRRMYMNILNNLVESDIFSTITEAELISGPNVMGDYTIKSINIVKN